jgi:hypothetical protein
MEKLEHRKKTAQSIRKAINKAASQKKKPIDTKKYFGKIDFGVDGLEYQKKIRSEWQ